MPDPVRERAAAQLEVALGRPVDLATLPADEPLTALGLDSLLAISALVAIAEDFGVDLADYVDTLDAPSTVRDLLAIAERFHADGASAGARA